MEYVFEANSLTKRFDNFVALDQIDLKIHRQSIVGLLGRNGSGKTTLFRHMMGLYLPTEGTVATLGKPSARLGHDELIHIGFVVVVWIWTAYAPGLFATPLVELTVSALLFLLSQILYRQKLRTYFSTADLV